VNFNSHTDLVVAIAVDLVNLLTAGERRGKAYRPPAGPDAVAELDALLRGSGGRGLTRPEDAGAPSVAADFTAVAGALRAVFAAVAAGEVDAAAGRVNELLRGTGAHPVLERHDGEPWHVHFHADGDGSTADGWAAGCATGLAMVLGSEYADRLGVCTAPRCDRVYVDTSRNGSRRFCSTACQNRVKAAAFRERRG
jgi:predicted RNA-binding Zn ribbon-like protein